MKMKITKVYNKISSSRDGRKLAENFLSLSIIQICGYVFPILTFPYLSRTLGVELFGMISFAAAVNMYFQTVVDWGFNLTATRDIARNQENIDAVNKILSLTMYSKLILMFACLLILSILCIFVPVFHEKSLLLYLTFLLVPGHIFFPDWFFQGIEKMRYITILNFIIKLIFTVLVFFTIKGPEDYLIQPLLYSLGYIVAGVSATYLIYYKWKYHFVKVSFSDCLRYIKNSTDVFINTLMPNFYNSFSMLLLGFWGGNVANGILEGGARFVTIAGNFMQVINRAFFPLLARRIDKHSLFVRLNLSCALAVSIVLFVFAPQIINLFLTGEFENSIIVLRILAFSLFFMALSNSFGANYLIICRKERLCRNITMAASLGAFVLGWILIYNWTWLGAALVIFLGRLFMGVGLFAGAYVVKQKNDHAVAR